MPLTNDLDQFTNFLNQNRISFSEFESDLSQTFGDEGSFSSAFDSYFSDSFFKETGLDSDLFKINLTLTDGAVGEVSGGITASDESAESYEQIISDYLIFYSINNRWQRQYIVHGGFDA